MNEQMNPRGLNVKYFEQSYGLDTMLCRNIPLHTFDAILKKCSYILNKQQDTGITYPKLNNGKVLPSS